MTSPVLKFFRAVRNFAGRLRAANDDFLMWRFIDSLPEDIRRDIGWPDFDGNRCERGR